MKFRSGFVSNSSSSSFIVTRGEMLDCPIDVAYHMILQREWLDDSKLFHQLMDMVKTNTISRFTNLCFRSTNYDTYVYFRPVDPNYDLKTLGIRTCNNVDWDFPTAVKLADDEEDNKIYDETHNYRFTMIESGLMGTRIGDELAKEISDVLGRNACNFCCTACHNELWFEGKHLLNPKIFCPTCGKPFYQKNARWNKV